MFWRCLLAVVLVAVVSADDNSLSNGLWSLDRNTAETNGDEEGGYHVGPSIDISPDEDIHCQTDKGEQGVCIVRYLCDPDSLTTSGTETPLGWDTQCTLYQDVCCGHANILPADSLPATDQSVVLLLKD